MAVISLGMAAATFNRLSDAQKTALVAKKRQEAVQQFGGTASDWSFRNPLGGEFGNNLILENTSLQAPSDTFDEEGGAFPGFREDTPIVTPTGGEIGRNAQVSDALTREEILASLLDGDIQSDEAAVLLVRFGHARDNQEATAIIIQNQASSPLDDGAEPGTGTAIPTAIPERVDQPTVVQDAGVSTPSGFTDDEFSEFAGQRDIARQFAVSSGVAPAFRNAFEGIVNRQALPFNIQALTGNLPGLDQDQFAETPVLSFRDFLNRGQRGSLPDIGQSLRTAGDFLRAPAGRGGEFNTAQQGIQDRLLNQSGFGTSAFFNPLIEAVGNRQRGRGLAGFDLQRATRTSLRNQLSGDPGQFSGVTDFTDFLRRQGLI